MKEGFKCAARQLPSEEDNEILERFELLLTRGKWLEGTSPSIDIAKRPDYFNQEKFDSAQKTVNKYYLGLAMSSTIGLMLLIQLEEILIPLLRTGKSRTIPDLYDRYSATAKYIKRCYESRFYDPTSDGWRYVNMIRAMHQRIYKIMNEDELNRMLVPQNERNNLQYVWVNQFDMALTQFAFIGLFVLRPDKCGSRNVSEREMSELIYFWRLLSYQIGIEDKFNLFAYHEHLGKQMRLLDLVFDQFKQRLATPRKQVGVRMAQGILHAFEELSADATLNIIEHHWFDVISLTGRQELSSYDGIGELCKLARFRLVFNLSSRYDFARRLIISRYKKKLEKYCRDGQKIRKKLAKKYPAFVYELDDPSINTDS